MLDDTYKIASHCNKIHYSVNKGLQKFLNIFINEYHPSKFISEVNKRLYDNSEYVDCGFSHIIDTPPLVFYTSNGKNRLKNIDISKMDEYHKIYDCGRAVFEINI